MLDVVSDSRLQTLTVDSAKMKNKEILQETVLFKALAAISPTKVLLITVKRKKHG